MTDKNNGLSEKASDKNSRESLSDDYYNKTDVKADVNLNDNTDFGGEHTVYNADITTDLEKHKNAYEQQEKNSDMQEIYSNSAAVSRKKRTL